MITRVDLKHDLSIYCLHRTCFKCNNTEAEVKAWEKVQHINSNQRKAQMAILISDEIDYRAKKIPRDRKDYYAMMKGSIYQEDSNSVCTSNCRAAKRIEQTDRIEITNSQIHSYSYRLHHLFVNN